MLTRKKMEKQLRSIWFHYHRLNCALYAAKDSGLIKFENYADESPHASLWEVKQRVETNSQAQIAEVIQSEIRSEVRP